MQVHGEVGETLRQQDPSSWSLSPSLSHVEEAVSFLWATKLFDCVGQHALRITGLPWCRGLVKPTFCNSGFLVLAFSVQMRFGL